jgi:probable HAF family extracellular repeat protein
MFSIPSELIGGSWRWGIHRAARVGFGLALYVLVAVATQADAGAIFMPIGSRATSVSADGSVVVGVSDADGFRWTATGGTTSIPGFLAQAVSADGSVVVGSSAEEAARWTDASGIVLLGDLPGGRAESSAEATSKDGSVVVGRGSSSNAEGFHWTAANGMVGLGDLPGGVFFSAATAISADGLVVAGNTHSASGNEAFIWTAGGGMVGLGDIEGGGFASLVHDISADGSTVVGSGYVNSSQAMLWTAAGGMVSLGLLPGSDWSISTAVSGDGSVVVGISETLTERFLFIWDAVQGMRDLRSLLVAQGVDLEGWYLQFPYDISANGRTIVGAGAKDGQLSGWVVTLPEPSHLLLVAVVLALVRRPHRPS